MQILTNGSRARFYENWISRISSHFASERRRRNWTISFEEKKWKTANILCCERIVYDFGRMAAIRKFSTSTIQHTTCRFTAISVVRWPPVGVSPGSILGAVRRCDKIPLCKIITYLSLLLFNSKTATMHRRRRRPSRHSLSLWEKSMRWFAFYSKRVKCCDVFGHTFSPLQEAHWPIASSISMELSSSYTHSSAPSTYICFAIKSSFVFWFFFLFLALTSLKTTNRIHSGHLYVLAAESDQSQSVHCDCESIKCRIHRTTHADLSWMNLRSKWTRNLWMSVERRRATKENARKTTIEICHFSGSRYYAIVLFSSLCTNEIGAGGVRVPATGRHTTLNCICIVWIVRILSKDRPAFESFTIFCKIFICFRRTKETNDDDDGDELIRSFSLDTTTATHTAHTHTQTRNEINDCVEHLLRITRMKIVFTNLWY